MTMFNELQIESTRQFQTVVFYSQFLDANATETAGKEVFESWSCSLSNVADAFDADGPTVGNSLFFYNYYGSNLLVDSEGLFNELNLDDRIPLEDINDQVWRPVMNLEKTNLVRKSGGTDAYFLCTAQRPFKSVASQM